MVARKIGFDIVDKHSIDEVDICARALRINTRTGTMVDVGAHIGGSAEKFCRAGWSVLAFEPDPTNREQLVQNLGGSSSLRIDERALSNKEEESVTFYQSPQSTVISGLSAFDSSHEAAGTVAVTTLKIALEAYDIDEVDFLKIDVEGFDKFVLEGLSWEDTAPLVITCEFEDFKTRPLGYEFTELAAYLADKGYQVMVSEWLPIVAYGGKHEWSDFKLWPCKLNSEKAWGNLIASRDPEVFQRITGECGRIKAKLKREIV